MTGRILILLLLFVFLPLSRSEGAVTAKKFRSSSDMTVILLESHSLPMLQIDLLVPAGASLDPPAREGLASLTASLLEEGTEHRTSREVADALDAIGTEFAVNPGPDYTTFSMKLLKKDVEKGLDLFSDILIHPKFPEEELAREKVELLSRLADQKDDPETVASKAFDKAIFGAHPYRHPVEGDEESVKQIEAGDLKRFYTQYYGSKGSILALAGDLSENDARTLVEKYFGLWRNKPVSAPKHPLPAKIMKQEVVLTNKELAQSSIILGNIGISRKNPDYYPLQVMNYILGGGGFSSRMLSNIRDNKGLVYSLSSHFASYLETGSFEVVLQTKNRSANEAIQEVLGEIRRIQEKPVTPEELQEAKDYLIGSFPLKMDTLGKLAGLLLSEEFFDLGLDYYDKYTRWIKAVTAQDVQRVARTYLDPDHFVLVAVGKQSEASIHLPPPAGKESGP